MIKSNNKTIALFDEWYMQRNISVGMKEQDVLVELMHKGANPTTRQLHCSMSGNLTVVPTGRVGYRVFPGIGGGLGLLSEYPVCPDTDVLWLRNPFPRLTLNETVDLQISVDRFDGDQWSQTNPLNTGFYMIKSNNKTIALFDEWYMQRTTSVGMKEQYVLVELMHNIKEFLKGWDLGLDFWTPYFSVDFVRIVEILTLFQLFMQIVSNRTLSTRTVSTRTVSTRTVSTRTVSSRTVSTRTVSTHTVSKPNRFD
ncbi:putative nucleotide-diphospho-sugar transferase [Helianthus debilis subsp. tardiflorus]